MARLPAALRRPLSCPGACGACEGARSENEVQPGRQLLSAEEPQGAARRRQGQQGLWRQPAPGRAERCRRAEHAISRRERPGAASRQLQEDGARQQAALLALAAGPYFWGARTKAAELGPSHWNGQRRGGLAAGVEVGGIPHERGQCWWRHAAVLLLGQSCGPTALARLPRSLVRVPQAHFSAPSSVRRKLMTAPLSQELKNKYGVSNMPCLRPRERPWRACARAGAAAASNSAVHDRLLPPLWRRRSALCPSARMTRCRSSAVAAG